MHRLFYQYRVKEWGKWRPSAEAKRLGGDAITLEKLMTRDGCTFSEAARRMSDRAPAELEAIYYRLPPRQPRPVLVSDDGVSEIASSTTVDDVIEIRDREQSARTAARVVDETIATFDAEDRLILQLRFWHARRAARCMWYTCPRPKAWPSSGVPRPMGCPSRPRPARTIWP